MYLAPNEYTYIHVIGGLLDYMEIGAYEKTDKKLKNCVEILNEALCPTVQTKFCLKSLFRNILYIVLLYMFSVQYIFSYTLNLFKTCFKIVFSIENPE